MNHGHAKARAFVRRMGYADGGGVAAEGVSAAANDAQDNADKSELAKTPKLFSGGNPKIRSPAMAGGYKIGHDMIKPPSDDDWLRNTQEIVGSVFR